MDITAVAIGESPLPSFVVLEQHGVEEGRGGAADTVRAGGAAPQGAEGETGEKTGEGARADAAQPPSEKASRKPRPRRLPIRIGEAEATAISRGVDAKKTRRPKTHDLFKTTIEALGAELLCARITKVSGTTFYAQLVLRAADGSEVCVDARPSDAIALAVRFGVNVLASEEVLEAASMLDFREVEQAVKASELADFHKFVENVSPDDFKQAE